MISGFNNYSVGQSHSQFQTGVKAHGESCLCGGCSNGPMKPRFGIRDTYRSPIDAEHHANRTLLIQGLQGLINQGAYTPQQAMQELTYFDNEWAMSQQIGSQTRQAINRNMAGAQQDLEPKPRRTLVGRAIGAVTGLIGAIVGGITGLFKRILGFS